MSLTCASLSVPPSLERVPLRLVPWELGILGCSHRKESAVPPTRRARQSSSHVPSPTSHLLCGPREDLPNVLDASIPAPVNPIDSRRPAIEMAAKATPCHQLPFPSTAWHRDALSPVSEPLMNLCPLERRQMLPTRPSPHAAGCRPRKSYPPPGSRFTTETIWGYASLLSWPAHHEV